MAATIRPVGFLKTYINNLDETSVEAGRSVRLTLAALGIPSEVVALVIVNEEQQDKDYVLQDGDVVRLLAVIGGGAI